MYIYIYIYIYRGIRLLTNHASTRATAGGMAPAAKAEPRKRNPAPGGYYQPIRNVQAKERAAVLADVAAAAAWCAASGRDESSEDGALRARDRGQGQESGR